VCEKDSHGTATMPTPLERLALRGGSRLLFGLVSLLFFQCFKGCFNLPFGIRFVCQLVGCGCLFALV